MDEEKRKRIREIQKELKKIKITPEEIQRMHEITRGISVRNPGIGYFMEIDRRNEERR